MKRNSDSVKNRGRSSKTAPVLTAKLKCKQAALQCIVLLGMLMLAPFAHAQTTWTGISDSDWDNPANWSTGIPIYTAYDGQLGRGRYNSNAVTGGKRVSW